MRVTEVLRDRLKDMRPSEAEVARKLLRDLQLVADKSLREVAALFETSDATVMRACRAAGFDGFQDLKYNVLRELMSGRPATATSQPAKYQEDINATLASAKDAIARAACIIRDARRIALVGVGASHGIALVATDILFTLQKQALPIANEQGADFVFTPPTTGLALIAISHSGETQFTVKVAREARQARVPTIAITNEPGSELAREADVVVATQAVESGRGSFAITPRICELALLDALFQRACNEKGAATKEATS